MADLVLDISGNAVIKLRTIEKGLEKVDKEAKQVSKTFKTFSSISGAVNSFNLGGRLATGFSSALIGLKVAAIGVAASFVTVNSKMEQMRIMLETATGSTEIAGAAFRDIFKFAENAPFSIGVITDSFVKLKTAGLDPMDGTLQILMDSISAFGGTSEQLELITIAIRQMVGKGVISMEELRRQFGEQVPTAMKAMATGLGVTYAEMIQQIETGNLYAMRGINAMLGELEKLHGGASQRRMESFLGAITRLKNTWILFLHEIGTSNNSFGAITEYIQVFTASLKKLTFEADEAGGPIDRISQGIVKFFNDLTNNQGTVQGFLDMVIEKVAGTIELMSGFARMTVGFLKAVNRIVNAYDLAKLAMKAESISLADLISAGPEDAITYLEEQKSGVLGIKDSLSLMNDELNELQAKQGIFNQTGGRGNVDQFTQADADRVQVLQQLIALEQERLVIRQQQANVYTLEIPDPVPMDVYTPATQRLDDFHTELEKTNHVADLFIQHIEVAGQKVKLLGEYSGDPEGLKKYREQLGKLLAEDPMMQLESEMTQARVNDAKFNMQLTQEQLQLEKSAAEEKLSLEKSLINKTKQLTLSDLDYQKWKLSEEIAAYRETADGKKDINELINQYEKAALADLVTEHKGASEAAAKLWKDFVSNTGDAFRSLTNDVIRGEINTIKDLFEELGDFILDLFIDLASKIAANFVLDKIFGSGFSSGSLSLTGITSSDGLLGSALRSMGFGAAGSAAKDAAMGTTEAVTGSGAMAWIASKLGFGAGTTGTGSAYAAAMAQEVAALNAAAGAGSAGTAGAATTGSMAGLGMGAGLFGLAVGIGTGFSFGGGKSIDEMLNEAMVQPVELAVAGVKDHFTDLAETTAGPLSDAFLHYDQVSIDTANNVMVLGQELGSVNGVIGENIQVFNAATGAWETSNVTMSDLINRMRELDSTTDMSTQAIASMVAAEAGLPSLTDELTSSYRTLGAATSQLASMSTAAATAMRGAAGNAAAALNDLKAQLAAGELTGFEFDEASHALDHLAKGGVRGGAGIGAYSNKVVNKPTLFPFATGGMFGLMGEAGAEAILPLMRTNNGDLGVKSESDNDLKKMMVALLITNKKTTKILERFEYEGIPQSTRSAVS